MSLLITICTREGIVMASDSRTSFNREMKRENERISQHGIGSSDTCNKTFLTSNRIGISTCRDGGIDGVPIGGYIEDFIREKIAPDTEIQAVPNLLMSYFHQFDPVPNTQFMVAGYEQDEYEVRPVVYEVLIKENRWRPIPMGAQGIVWAGESDVLNRLFSEIYVKTPEGEIKPVPRPELAHRFFTLQDAIDFAVYGIETTKNTMRFQMRIKSVGGPIDVLVIKPQEAFWVQKKELHI